MTVHSHDSYFYSCDTFPNLTHKLLLIDTRINPKSHICPKNLKGQMCALTWCFVSKEARDLALAVLLLFIRQQLVDKLPDHLFGWGIQHREHIHDQSVNIPVAMETQAR